MQEREGAKRTAEPYVLLLELVALLGKLREQTIYSVLLLEKFFEAFPHVRLLVREPCLLVEPLGLCSVVAFYVAPKPAAHMP